VIKRPGDARAPEVLDSVHTPLQASATTNTEATLRDSSVGNIPGHHEIVAACAAHQSASTGKH
jgi:hypothetical protein